MRNSPYLDQGYIWPTKKGIDQHTCLSQQGFKYDCCGTSVRKMVLCLTSSSSLCAVNERPQTAPHARSCGNMSRDSMARRRGSRTLRTIEVSPQPVLLVEIHGYLKDLNLYPQNLSSPAVPITIPIQRVSSHRQNHFSMLPSTTASLSSRSACRPRIWN